MPTSWKSTPTCRLWPPQRAARTACELLFLDVELPDMTGIEFLERMNGAADGACHVVMYTAYADYMLPAFRNKAFDFLLKPVDEGELDTIMRRFSADVADAPRQAKAGADMRHLRVHLRP